MANIEIIYRVPYCENCDCGLAKREEFNTQCFTAVAGDTGCKYFNDGSERIVDGKTTKVIPFGNCVHAKFKYIYKGWSGARYEMEEVCDVYNPNLDCMEVVLGNKLYACVKVTLNGKCIYNIYDDEEPSAM